MSDDEGKGLFQLAGPPDDWPEHATLPPAPWEPGRFELMDHGVIDLGLDLRFTKGRTTMGDRDDGWLPADEKLSPERAVRLLRAKGAELEHWFAAHADDPKVPVAVLTLAPDIALIAQLLADHIERTEDRLIDGVMAATAATQPLATQQRLDTDDANVREYTESQRLHTNDHIIDLRDDGWMIQHPLSERLAGTLFDCTVTWKGRAHVDNGRYVMVWDEEADEWVLGEKVQ